MRTLVISQFYDARVVGTEFPSHSLRVVHVGFACNCGDPEKRDHVGASIPETIVLN